MKKILKTVAVLSGLVIISMVLLWVADPVAFRFYVFQPIRELRFLVKELDLLDANTTVSRLYVEAPVTARVPKDFASQPELTVDVWPVPDSPNRPVLVFMHGSSPWGRKAAFAQLFAQRFNKKGWNVVLPDARGFGESDDPRNVNDPDDWIIKDDVDRVLRYAANLENADASRIVVVGHSAGGSDALEGALLHPLVAAIVLIGPTRYVDGTDKKSSLWEKARIAADMRLEDPVSDDVIASVSKRADIRMYLDDILSKAQHKPLLILDGEWEGQTLTHFMALVVAKIAPPVQYETVAGAGHYCGVRSLLGSSVVYFNEAILARCEQPIEQFLDKYVR